MDDLVAQLTGITGTSDHIARQLLEMANNDLGQAVVLFYDTDMAAVLARQAPSASASATAPAASSTRTGTSASRAARAPAHREDGRGVIHIDDSDDDNAVDFEDDDDGLVDIDDDNSDDAMADAAGAHRGHGGHADDAEAVALRAQEEEDAAMAKRLQEEMYAEQPGGGSGGAGGTGGAAGDWQDADEIRAPLGRTTETLVDPVYGDVGGGFGGGYGFGGPSLYQRMRQQRGGALNPFSQVWDSGMDQDDHDDDMMEAENEAPGSSYARLSTEPDVSITSSVRRGRGGAGGGGGAAAAAAVAARRGGGAATSRAARLADLFRPPYDLMDHSIRSWDDARAVGKDEKKWILANIQDMSDFLCQALNRDIWKDEAVKQLVRENFVFLQYNKDEMAAESYIQYYMPGGQHENPDNFPHVGIVDPRTGEQVKVWSGRPFPTALEFHAQLVEFLDRYSLDASKKNPVQRTKAAAVVKDVGRMTEDEMLEMALKNSLETSGGGGSGVDSGSGSGSVNGSRAALVDPDQLTGTPAAKGKGKEVADEADADVDAEEAPSAFAQIAADRPHDEPPAGPTVTRIQFRHPGGRVIRRFHVDDPVERIYEWLKAAPLSEDKAGVEFELKPVPATPGRDLLEELGKTIEEAGLKQATVMIEYIE